jgi:hypothetical protein
VNSPVEVVRGQLEKYNARDLAGFLEHFSETVQVFRPPVSEPVLSGKLALGEFYATQRFNRPDLHATVLHRIELGNKVIDHERIEGVQEEPFELVVIYEIEQGLIQTLWTHVAR